MSGFPEKGADLRRSPGNFRGKSGELPGKSGKLPGNPWIAAKFHSERTSGEVAEKLPGKFGELLGKSAEFPEARGSLTPSQRLAKFFSKQKKRAFKASKYTECTSKPHADRNTKELQKSPLSCRFFCVLICG